MLLSRANAGAFLQSILFFLFICFIFPSFAFANTATRYVPVEISAIGGLDYDSVRDITIDSVGNIYTTGGTRSQDFPSTMKISKPGAAIGGMDIFVTKQDPMGKLLWSVIIGGPYNDRAYSLELDHLGRVCVGGRAGKDFPTSGHSGPFAGGISGGGTYGTQDGIVFCLNQGKSKPRLAYSVYFGASSDGEIIRDIAVDPKTKQLYFYAAAKPGAIYPSHLAGKFLNSGLGGSDGVVGALSQQGNLQWARFVGGSDGDEANEGTVRVGADGGPVVLTLSNSTDGATSGSYQEFNASIGLNDWYLAKLSTSGALQFATYLGGSSYEHSETHNLAVNSLGQFVIAAGTLSDDLPIVGRSPIQSQFAGIGGTGTGAKTNYAGDGFLAILSADGSQLLASTYFGGVNGESFEGVGLDSGDNVYVTGATFSSDYPVTKSAYAKTKKGSADVLLTKFSSDLSNVIYSSFLGGSSTDYGRAAHVTSTGVFLSAGQTRSSNFPIYDSQFGNHHGDWDGFLSVLVPWSKK